MRIDRRVALVLAAMLGAALGGGCQRKDYLVPNSDMATPSRPEDRTGTAGRSGGDASLARPGSPDALGPHPHPFVHPYVPMPHQFMAPPYEPIDTRRDLIDV